MVQKISNEDLYDVLNIIEEEIEKTVYTQITMLAHFLASTKTKEESDKPMKYFIRKAARQINQTRDILTDMSDLDDAF